jgi:hypothetical protein
MTSMLKQHSALGHVLAFVIVHLKLPLLMALVLDKITNKSVVIEWLNPNQKYGYQKHLEQTEL